MAIWAGYTRVSRVGDRGDRLLSPELQSEAITAWARARKAEITLLRPELNESGGRKDRPILEEALKGIEEGRFRGVIVAKLDRLSRSLLHSLEIFERVEKAGGAIVAVAEQIDSSTSAGRMQRNMLFAVGNYELDRYKENFLTVKESAVRRGIWPTPRPPHGYRVGPDRRLVPDERAPLVVQAFEARAAGASWSAIAQILGSGMSKAGRTIRNRAYLGELNLGPWKNPKAHEPLVTRSVWEAAQVSHPRPARGKWPPALLVGLVRCAACGCLMSPSSSERWRGYRCRPLKVGRRCPAPAMISARLLDSFVEAVVLSHVEGMAYSLDAPTEIAEAEQALEAVETELAAYQKAQSVSGLGEEHFLEGMRSRVDAIEEARRQLVDTRSVVSLPDSGLVAELWPSLSVEERRHALRGSLLRVEVSRGRDRVWERARLFDRSGALIAIPEHLRDGPGEVGT